MRVVKTTHKNTHAAKLPTISSFLVGSGNFGRRVKQRSECERERDGGGGAAGEWQF